MTDLQYLALRKLSYALVLTLCFYILLPVLYFLIYANPSIGMSIMIKFETLEAELKDIEEQMEAQTEAETPAVIRQVM